MRRLVTLAGAAILTVFAGPAYATTPSTTPDCAEHGHDAEHNPHCDESTTTTVRPETTTTTFLPELPSGPTATTATSPAPTTTATSGPTVAPPHLDLPAVLPTTTTTTTAAGVAGHHETKRLPATGTPAAFLAAVGVLCLLCGGGVLRARRPPG